MPAWWNKLRELAHEEIRHLTTIQDSDRAWQMPLAAMLATGLPLLIGAYFGRLNFGLVSSLGGLVFLYLPGTPLYHRMISVMVCSFGMTACYAMGMISHFFPALMMPVLVFIAIFVTMIVRFYQLGPPGSLFFIMAASIGAFSPVQPLQIPLMVGLMAMGNALACFIAFVYSVILLRTQEPKPIEPLQAANFDYVVFDSVIIGCFVGIALIVAQLLNLERPYWVPVSCLAVIQGVSLRAVWNRQLQRVLGTTVGMLLAWGLLLVLPLNQWTIPATVMILTVIIESTVTRHYGFAVVFITPMAILLAEAATFNPNLVTELIMARYFDTLLGCVMGLIGGICLHSPRFRAAASPIVRRLIPMRLLP